MGYSEASVRDETADTHLGESSAASEKLNQLVGTIVRLGTRVINWLALILAVAGAAGWLWFSLPPIAPIWALLCICMMIAAVVVVTKQQIAAQRLDELWFAILISGVLVALTVTDYAENSIIGQVMNDVISWSAILLPIPLLILFGCAGAKSGGKMLLALSLAAGSMYIYAPTFSSIQQNYRASTEAAEANAKENAAYQAAMELLQQRLDEVDAPKIGRTLESRLDLAGLSRIEADTLRQALVTVREYEAANNIVSGQGFGSVSSGLPAVGQGGSQPGSNHSFFNFFTFRIFIIIWFMARRP